MGTMMHFSGPIGPRSVGFSPHLETLREFGRSAGGVWAEAHTTLAQNNRMR